MAALIMPVFRIKSTVTIFDLGCQSFLRNHSVTLWLTDSAMTLRPEIGQDIRILKQIVLILEVKFSKCVLPLSLSKIISSAVGVNSAIADHMANGGLKMDLMSKN